MIKYSKDGRGITIELTPESGVMVNTVTSSFFGYRIVEPEDWELYSRHTNTSIPFDIPFKYSLLQKLFSLSSIPEDPSPSYYKERGYVGWMVKY